MRCHDRALDAPLIRVRTEDGGRKTEDRKRETEDGLGTKDYGLET